MQKEDSYSVRTRNAESLLLALNQELDVNNAHDLFRKLNKLQIILKMDFKGR